jgi:6-phosphogluconolactonase
MKPENQTTAVVDAQRSGNSADGLSHKGSARRHFLLGAAGGMATFAAGGLISAARHASAAEPAGGAAPLFAYVGCFSSARRKAEGKGISVYRIDPDGAWTQLQTLETVPNPQFIAFDRQQRFLYSVHGDGTEVSAYAIDKPSGRLRFLNKQPTNGNNFSR